MFFKKILMPCGLCAAIPAINPSSSGGSMLSSSKEAGVKKLIRPSELPIYPLEEDYSKQSSCSTDCPPSFLEQNISQIRKSVQAVASEYQHYSGIISDKIDISYEHSKSLLDYLREESNVMPRIGAIGIGGLAGLILGLRGRTFKRLVYTSTGALTMAALCYPKKTKEGVEVATHYVNVGYNFIRGVKPGDEQQQKIAMLEMKFPKSFSECVDLTILAGSATVSAFRDIVQNIYVTFNDNKEKNQSMTETNVKTEADIKQN